MMGSSEDNERSTSAAGTASNIAAAPPSPRKFDLSSPTLNRPGEELQRSQSSSRTASHGRQTSHSTGVPSTPKTPASSSSATSPTQRRTHTPRRSVAHNPELLGLGLSSDFSRASSSSSSSTKRVSGSGVASHRARSGSSSTAATTTDLFNYDAESEADCFELHRVDLDDVRSSMELQQQQQQRRQHDQQRAAPPSLSSASALHAQTEARSQTTRQDHDKAGTGACKTEDDEDEDEERYLPSFGHDALPAMTKTEHEAALRLDDDPFSGGSPALHNTYGYQGHIRNGDYGTPGYHDDGYLDDEENYNDNDDDDDLERGLAANQKRLLHFEAVTPRERVWMWTSVGLVMVLTAVSIAISVNWIDWPGDGLGKY